MADKSICYSFGGEDERFGYGAIKHAALARTLLPDWKVIGYHDDTVATKFIRVLSNMSHVEVLNIATIDPGYKMVFGAFWRFLPMFEREGHFIVRDTDSRLTAREARAVEEWVSSGRTFHTIRDHEANYEWPVLACMWGMRGGVHPYFHEQMKKNWLANFYTIDQVYLAQVIWPAVQQSVLVHGMREGGWFADTRKNVGYNFVGEGWYEDDTPIYSYDMPSRKFNRGQEKGVYNSAL